MSLNIKKELNLYMLKILIMTTKTESITNQGQESKTIFKKDIKN
jgi:hypothetical protein